MYLLACFHDSMVKDSGIHKGRYLHRSQTLYLEKIETNHYYK